jgi:hypothetical protein
MYTLAMDEAYLSLLMRALKGPASACLMALSLVEHPVTARWLAHTTGYSPNTITRALRLLEQLGLVAHDGRRSGWRSEWGMQRRAAGQEPGVQAIPAESEPPAGDADHPSLPETPLLANTATEIANCDALDLAPAACLAEQRCAVKDIANCDSLESKEDSLRLLKSQAIDSDSGKPPQFAITAREVIAGRPASGVDPPEIPEKFHPPERVARLLQAARVLFDEPVMVPPGPPVDARLALAWIAQAYQLRRKLSKPARVVYAQLKRGELPYSRYLDDPLSCLPVHYLEAAGLRAPPAVEGEPPQPEEEPPTEEQAAAPLSEPHPSLSLPVSPGSPYSAQQAWQQALEVALQLAPPGLLRQGLRAVELLQYDPGQGLFTLLAQDAQAQQLMQERLAKLLQRWLQGICQRSVLVRFEAPPAQPS